MKVLEVNNLHKTLGKRKIINGINFDVEEGQVFGFIGPNGAGKTTTIRMLVGLISPDSGTVKIMGHNIKTDREKALNEVGVIVENPEIYTYLTGRQNLQQLARIYKNVTDKDINEVIEVVGLKDRIDDKVKKYSLGMKQRLGIAESLMNKPKMLILDEPTNGLDPSGIIELRTLVRKLAKENGMSVFVSSHMLSEVEQMCDIVAFTSGGVIQSVEKVNDESKKDKFDNMILKAQNKEKALESLKNIDIVDSFECIEEDINIKVLNGNSPKLISELVNKGVLIDEIYKKHIGLEDRYMELFEGGRK